ncbi:MAG: hypothetical protein IPK15_17375 [Verrucomicrobia bacterium]|nr:hypothetical protein [Verrucomicrobiota bacterium]
MNATKSSITAPTLFIVGALHRRRRPRLRRLLRSHRDHSQPLARHAAAKAYPLNKCLVTDEGFDHGKPYTFVHHGQEIKLCCEDCLADFKKEPSKYLSKLTSK